MRNDLGRAGLLCCALLLVAPAIAQEEPAAPPVAVPVPPALTADSINAATLALLPAQFVPEADEPEAEPTSPDMAPQEEIEIPRFADPGMARLQIMLDRGGASPGVVDGFDGENVRKAVAAFEALNGLPADGVLDPALLALLDVRVPVVGGYVITPEDAASVVAPLPEDYAELAQRDYLGYTSVPEALAEKFHMDVDFLAALNPNAAWAPGEQVFVADPGMPRQGSVVRLVADKAAGQLLAFDAGNRLVAAYPATIGSEDNPSPSGEHTVNVIVIEPEYTYNPEVNFQQGDNTEVLTLPPGPNGPVGLVWIDLSEPTYGIHGTPQPSKIDKTGSHGCVRLTNWDALELAGMVEEGAIVSFI